MKWLILAIVIILAAPTLAKQLTRGPEKAERRGGIIYRSVRRYGPRKVGLAALVLIAAIAAAGTLFLGKM